MDVEQVKRRVLDGVSHVGDCWVWTGATSRANHRSARVYPYTTVDNRVQGVRPLVYKLWHLGPPLARGECVKDICGNSLCVNPAHLTVGRRGRPRANQAAAEWQRRWKELMVEIQQTAEECREVKPAEFRRRLQPLIDRVGELLGVKR